MEDICFSWCDELLLQATQQTSQKSADDLLRESDDTVGAENGNSQIHDVATAVEGLLFAAVKKHANVTYKPAGQARQSALDVLRRPHAAQRLEKDVVALGPEALEPLLLEVRGRCALLMAAPEHAITMRRLLLLCSVPQLNSILEEVGPWLPQLCVDSIGYLSVLALLQALTTPFQVRQAMGYLAVGVHHLVHEPGAQVVLAYCIKRFAPSEVAFIYSALS
eukprot:TRINITY_DN14125_c0_g1_i1.p1 TRINITY_DN14125_c0_g1~~TRINITY_DN14125_c0_g1_i1.p1  ORF type:complete len:238 (-),score=36.02 TRINITY_DN14125_c0_g1_i1:218-880(-)